MRQPRPIIRIKHQALTTSPIATDATLVDDTVMTVDGTALVGSQTTIYPSIPAKVKTARTYTKVQKRR